MTPSPSEMPKPAGRLHKPTSSSLSDVLMFIGGSLVALLFVWSLWSVAGPNPSSQSPNFSSVITTNTQSDGSSRKFSMPDPRLGKPITDWDTTRRLWLTLHPHLKYHQNRILMLTGSQPSPCRSPVGDHLLLRFFKNKVDYCRIHGCEIFYNNVLLQPQMFAYWAKYPVIRAAMIAHPEVEWIWWVDSDAAITDMSFQLPLQRYADYNLVAHGWNDLIYGKRKSWYGVNAGVFLIRNCQWSMDLMEKWSSMGPISPDYPKWGSIQKSVFPDKLFPEADDQTGLLYLLVKENEKWAEKVYIENEYYFQGYWLDIVGRLKNLTESEEGLNWRQPEQFDVDDNMETERIDKDNQEETSQRRRRPFITHFTGCQPCSGKHNEMYPGDSCLEGMEMALNFADNQVLLNYGYFRPDLLNSSRVEPLPGL